MSFEQYLRRWRVTVGTFQSEEIDCKFTINRSLWGIGTAELELFNLTKQHRDEIHNAHNAATAASQTAQAATDNRRRSGPIVRIEAGYKAEGSRSQLFQGNERTTRIRQEGTEITATLTAGDGQNAIRTRRASAAFGRDTQLVDVLEYLAGQIGVGSGNLRTAIADAELDQIGTTLATAFPHGTVVRGNAANELTRLLHSAGRSWSVQDGALQILPVGGTLQRDAILISANTGMIGTPEITNARQHVVTLSALIQPDLVPGRLIKIESNAVTGFYRIEQAKYSGDTIGKAWEVEMVTRLRPAVARPTT